MASGASPRASGGSALARALGAALRWARLSGEAALMATRRPIESAVATGRGDDGSTGLLFGGERIAKDDARTEAYGTIDEAVAALGLARSQLGLKEQYGVLSPAFGDLRDVILRIQRELFVAAAE